MRLTSTIGQHHAWSLSNLSNEKARIGICVVLGKRSFGLESDDRATRENSLLMSSGRRGPRGTDPRSVQPPEDLREERRAPLRGSFGWCVRRRRTDALAPEVDCLSPAAESGVTETFIDAVDSESKVLSTMLGYWQQHRPGALLERPADHSRFQMLPSPRTSSSLWSRDPHSSE